MKSQISYNVGDVIKFRSHGEKHTGEVTFLELSISGRFDGCRVDLVYNCSQSVATHSVFVQNDWVYGNLTADLS